MCVNQKCMSVESLRAMKSKCPQDCNGNGLCNSLGHCHCKDGFSPPFCDYPGPGGSEDSGPASDPNARKEFIMAMYIVFLGIIPIMAIVAFLMYYTKYNVNFKWQTGSSTYVLNCFLCVKHVVVDACCKRTKRVVPTISQWVSKRYSEDRPDAGTDRNIHLEIQQTGLIFTTNDMLNSQSSSNLLDIHPAQKRRMSFKNIKSKVNNMSFKKKDSNQTEQDKKTVETLCPEDESPALSVAKLKEQLENGGGSIC